jgi:penicillin-binding protein 1A
MATAKKQEESDYSKFVRWFWMLFIGGVLAAVLMFFLASVEVFGELPDHRQLENPNTNLASEIISSDGKTLAKFYFNDNRTPVSFEELPKHLVDALVATEDVRFFDHSGIDARGTLRAFLTLGKGGGASTISQQLAKQLFTKQVSSNKLGRAFQKIKEWVIAVRLERQYTKEEIITQYFNIYDFGNFGDGIRSASRIYFGKEPKELDVKESAMLVGMFKNSSLYNPRPNRNPIGTRNRRNTVLSQMVKYEVLSEKDKDSLSKRQLDLKYSPESHSDGTATYFRAYLKKYMKDWIDKNPKPDGTKYNLYNGGLKIYTTIDSRMQAYAEKAVSSHLKALQKEFFVQNTPKRNPTAPFLDLDKQEISDLMKRSIKQSERWRKMKYDLKKSEKEIYTSFEKPTSMSIFTWDRGEVDTIMKPMDSMRYYKHFLRAGMMSMNPQSGHVKAWVGGFNYRHFQYDMVKQGKRQVGSTFKPFVYATAIDQLHMSPCEKLPLSQITIEAGKMGNTLDWTPKNDNGKYGGELTLKDALANSVNTITARLMDKVGPVQVSDLAKKLGITSDIPPVPSIALGTPDISVYEMVGAYGAFANKGVYIEPIMVTVIADKNDTVLEQFLPKTADVLSEESAYVTVKLMEGVTNSGSGRRLRTVGADKWNSVYKEVITGYPYAFTNPIAGKTGTTQNQSDGWFMGMVPNLVTGVWVGGEDRATHFKSITYGQGATMALPIWGMYMKDCYADKDLDISDGKFDEPKDLSIEVDCDKYEETTNNTEVSDPSIDDLGL